MNRRSVAALIPLLLGLPACGPNALTKIQPDLDMMDQALNFGDVAIGDTSAPKVQQASAITEAQINLTVSIEGDTDGVFSFQPAAPTAIPPRGEVSISVVFTPKAVKSYAATLMVKTNDPKPANALRIIPISGTGATASIDVTPPTLSLMAMACPPGAAGPSAGNCSETKAVTIQNNGLVNLRLMSVSLVPSGPAPLPANLTLTMPPAGETILISGDMITMPVVWTPSSAEVGTFSASLQVQSDDPMMPTVTIPITATSTAVQPPSVCLNVLSVEQRTESSNNMGVPVYSELAVSPVSLYLDPTDAQTLYASPNGQVTLTSLVTNIWLADQANPNMLDTTHTPSVDVAAQMSAPCTFDPQGSPLTYSWSITTPMGSGAMFMPEPDPNFAGSESSDGSVTPDIAGGYSVTLKVTNGFGLSASASYEIVAQPHDDLLVQVQWVSPTPSGDIIDLDLHLIVDSGPGVPSPGPNTFLSEQDCYWDRPSPVWFSGVFADLVPALLRVDEGENGGFDDTDLQTVPQAMSSSYEAVVHYFSGTDPTQLQLSVFYQGNLVGQVLAPSEELTNNQIWVGASITFPAQCPVGCAGTSAGCCPPTVTPLQQYCTFVPGDVPNQFTGSVTNCMPNTTNL